MSSFFKKFVGKKICFLAVGNSLKGDDGVGIYAGERIPKKSHIRVFLCHSVPENFAMKPRSGEAVFIIDAIKSEGKDYLITDKLPNFATISDHGPSLRLTYDIIKSKTSEVYLIGIPVSETKLGEGLSDETKERADSLLKDMEVIWNGRN